ncbi:Uncharacterized protein M6B38_244210 [Iris pallida]|uniref:Core-2/I-branching beta-1,6-N-acetylglucosaminyltransferase family protein n=1 Tax=Iris pallida TaxID=29817 RepID=A0AAX6DIJ1_IRIPA|nr:Uncharacterized protein M6B38_244210 [Iris pallida]
MRKRTSSSSSSSRRWRTTKLAMSVLVLCVGSLLLTQDRFSRIMAAAAVRQPPPPPPKIAFLFIARNRLPLDLVWDAFFKGDSDGNRFSIYVHSRPGFVLNGVTTRSAFFHNRHVNKSIQVDWGESSMIEAERILIRSALEDSLNERFLFLSDSCIPLYSFSYIYDYIMSTKATFLDSFADTKEGRYNPKMHPIVPINNWRKGSQWAVLIRKHAEIMVNDDIVFPEFQKYCRRKSLPEFWRDRPVPAEGWKEHNCIPDEHYVQTLLAQKGLEGEITRRSLTHSAWDLSSSRNRERRGWHPSTYKLSDATPMLIKAIKDIDNINYETEYRREWCTSRGKPSKCFLFARKFTRAAALRLLNMSVSDRDMPNRISIDRIASVSADTANYAFCTCSELMNQSTIAGGSKEGLLD